MELLVVVVVVVAVILLAVAGSIAVRRRRPPTPAEVEAPSIAPTAPAGIRTLGDRLSGLFGRGSLDEAFWSELEETLITGDVGVATATSVVGGVRDSRPADTAGARDALQESLVGLFAGRDRALHLDSSPAVMVIVGVNGTGKTTSIAKLAHHLAGEGKQVVLGAADTFRAGAAEQLKTWADRVGAEFVGGEANSDPAAVAYRAFERAGEIGADVVIVDTAGRLHSNRNLMEELAKIIRVLNREAGSINETLLVLDATTGQNAIAQAHTFTDVVGVSGIVLSKLDGTARGGVVVAVEEDLDLPVKLIGVGEGMEDLIEFDPEAFVAALLGAGG